MGCIYHRRQALGSLHIDPPEFFVGWVHSHYYTGASKPAASTEVNSDTALAAAVASVLIRVGKWHRVALYVYMSNSTNTNGLHRVVLHNHYLIFVVTYRRISIPKVA